MFQKHTHMTSKVRNDITAHANEGHFVKETTNRKKLEKKKIAFSVLNYTELIPDVSEHEMPSLVWRYSSSTGNLMLLSFQCVHFQPCSTHSEKIKSRSARQRQAHRLQA